MQYIKTASLLGLYAFISRKDSVKGNVSAYCTFEVKNENIAWTDLFLPKTWPKMLSNDKKGNNKISDVKCLLVISPL